MRRARALSVFLLTVIFFLASGCSGGAGPVRQAEQVRDLYASAAGLEARVQATAILTGRELAFTLSWTWSPAAGSRVTVLAPESVAGISATLTGDGLSFTYDGAVLEIGNISDGSAVSPVEALPMLLSQWAAGMHVSSAYEQHGESDTLALSYERALGGAPSEEAPVTLSMRTWFDRERLTPLAAEVYLDGRMVLSCTYELFELT